MYVVGIDGGGTKTRVAVCDAAGAILRLSLIHIFARKLYYAENWEDAEGFRPYVYLDVSDGYALWEKAIDHHWFAVHSTSFPYKEYYSHLKRLRGIEGRRSYCECFMIPAEQMHIVRNLEDE